MSLDDTLLDVADALRLPSSPPARRRRRPSMQQTPNTATDNGYATEWRDRTSTQLEESAKAQQTTALILERVTGRLDDHDKRLKSLEARPDTAGTLTDHEHRIKSLEASPGDLRSWLGTGGGCFGQIIFACFSLFSIIISLIALLIPHLH